MKKTVSGMRNKISKAICAVMCMGMMLTGCGSSNDSSGGNGLSGRTTSVDLFGGTGTTEKATSSIIGGDIVEESQEMAFSRYLNKGQYQIWYQINRGFGKDSNVLDAIIIKDGKAIVIDQFDLSLGEIARMSDDEIYKYALDKYYSRIDKSIDEVNGKFREEDEYVQNAEEGDYEVNFDELEKRKERYQNELDYYNMLSSNKDDFTFDNYAISVETDSTGNNAKYETIFLKANGEYNVEAGSKFRFNVTKPTSATIYDSFYYGFTYDEGEDNEYFITRLDDNKIKILPDDVTTESYGFYIDRENGYVWDELFN